MLALTEYSLTFNYALPALAESIPDVSWAALEQAEIPLDQTEATKGDVYSMFNMASLGQSARAYRSGRCPVTRSYGASSITARARVSFYVHHSEGLEYSVVPSEGRLSLLPIKTFRQKKETIKTQYSEQFQLGWLPLSRAFTSNFATDCYDKQRKLVLPRPDIVQDNGFVYVKGAVWSVINVSGTSVSDKWTITIEHQQGERFARSIWVEVVWYEGSERKAVRLELKLAGCVIDEFNKCPYQVDPLDINGDGQGNGSDFWNYRINYSSALIVYGDCDGAVLKIYKDEEI
jgi:hypothetical protein